MEESAEHRERGIDPNFSLIAAAIFLIIVYGSLYPFHFRANPDSRGPAQSLLATWRDPPGRGDFAANILLYFPLGLFLIQIARRTPLALRIAVAILSGIALSICIELLQFYDEGRVSSMTDVYANTVGVAAGAAAGAVLFRTPLRFRLRTVASRPFVIILLVSWFGYRWFPFVPVIDLHKYWTAIKPLVISPTLSPLDLYRHTVIWLAVALLIEALFGVARSRLIVPLAVFAITFGRVLIVETALSPAEVAGAALSIALWSAWMSKLKARTRMIALLFAAEIAIESLRPFEFTATRRSFGWVPFGAFMRGSIELNIRSLLEKTFLYGSMVWLMVRAGIRFTPAVILSAAFVLSLRIGQLFLPGRSAEITDPIIVLIVAGVMKALRENPALTAEFGE